MTDNLCPSEESLSRMTMVKHTIVATYMNRKFTEVRDRMVVSDKNTGQPLLM
jgi:hypothetical protein